MAVLRWTRATVVLVALVGLGCSDRSLGPDQGAMPSPSFSKTSGSQTVPHVVVLREERPPASGFLTAVAKLGGRVVRRYDSIGVVTVSGLRDKGVATLAARADVSAIGRDLRVQWLWPARLGLAAQGEQSGAALFATWQWNLRQISADDAWLVSPQGTGALVCILDSGVDPQHVDLAGRVDLDKSASFVSGDPSLDDRNGHGTFVAALVVSNGVYMASVAPEARLCAVKVLNQDGTAGFDEVIAGTMYAATVGADVINMSLGSSLLSRSDPATRVLVAALQRAVRFAVRQGALVVAGAGNDTLDLDQTDGIVVPAELAGVLSVGATGPINQTNFDRLASYTNYGKFSVDLMAPGGENPASTGNLHDAILSACSRFVTSFNCGSGKAYLWGIGTSFAAPLVSGAAAVVESMLPGNQTSGELETCLFLGADNPDGLVLSPLYGRGRLNVLRSVQTPGCGLGVVVSPSTQLAFTTQPTLTPANGTITPAVQVTVQRSSDGNTVTSFNGSITVSIGTNVASGSLVGTFNRPVVNGVATFDDLSIDEPGTGYTLRATAVSATSSTPGDAVSSRFDVVATPAVQLAFTAQPANATAGVLITPPVQVTALDALYNPAPFTGDVTVSITSGTGASGATLSGTTTVTAVNGVATFVDLSVDKPGTGYTLTASTTGLVGATSSPFNVAARWAPQASGTTHALRGVWGASGSNVFAVGEGGTILHYDGASWSSQSSGMSFELRGVWGANGVDVYAVGDSGTILHYNGVTWSRLFVGSYTNLYGVWGTSGSDVYVVGDSTILHYDGASWLLQTSLPAPVPEYFRGVWGSGGSDVFVVGLGGTVLHNDGTGWTPQYTGSSAPLEGVWGASGSDVFAAGTTDTIFHYNGTYWSYLKTAVVEPQRSVWGTSGSNVFAVGNGGTILRYTGTTWVVENSGTFYALNGVWGANGSDVFVVGNNGIILHSAW